MIDELEQRAIASLKLASAMSQEYYSKPLIITYSGGKDSEVLLDLALRADIEFEAINNHTTADAPQTVYHIHEKFYELDQRGIHTEIIKPSYKGKPVSMWSLIPQKSMPPTRLVRYCCAVLKEQSASNRYIATGVRAAESVSRSRRAAFEVLGKTAKMRLNFTYTHAAEVYADAHRHDEIWDCKLISSAKQHKKLVCNPIIDWADTDVWRYIYDRKIKYNPVYNRGYFRVGCIGCPLATYRMRLKEFSDFPAYKQMYIHAFDRMLEVKAAAGKNTKWRSGEDVFAWWIGENPNQISIFDAMMEESK
ncbi:MAG: phosphoadenosine phosphosulfate reductase family protein [Clostridia bacterium]|nr:phosphoadenosine phosphosulfate reductase family protein [Clostridia bacterium]